MPLLRLLPLLLLALCCGRTTARPLLSQPIPSQQLPLRARVCGAPHHGPGISNASSTCVLLEVPEGPRQYGIGLMGRRHLRPDRGMWFRFNNEEASFWMRNTLIPLDLLFLREIPFPVADGQSRPAQVVAVTHGLQPCEAMPCPSVSAGVPIDDVVELAAGEARRRNWLPGTLLHFSWRPVPASDP